MLNTKRAQGIGWGQAHRTGHFESRNGFIPGAAGGTDPSHSVTQTSRKAITWELVRKGRLGPFLGPLGQNLYFGRITRWFISPL